MDADTGTRLLQGSAVWRRCLLRDTAVVGEAVMLATDEPAAALPDASGDFTGGYAGLAFDPRCRLFHARPEEGAVDQVLWGHTSALGVHDDTAYPFEISAAGTEVDGQPGGPTPERPLALACDARDYLYIADPAAKSVWLIDTWQQEVARQLPFDAEPLDLASFGSAVYVLLADASIWQLAPCEAPQRMDWPAVAGAERLALAAAANGRTRAWVLVRPGHFDARLHALHLNDALAAPFCTDLVLESDDLLVLAQRPGEDFRRLQMKGITPTPLPGLIAPHYDGRGIARAPDGRIAFWTAQGLRHAAPARARYRQQGLLFGFALDAGQDQSRWGRLVVEACLPAGTALRFWAFTRDELDYSDPLAAGEPRLLSQRSWDANTAEPQALFRDPSQRALAPAPADGFALFDAPVIAPPGRYLWLVFELLGTRSKSPRLLSARVDYPGHGLLGQLPRTLWREPAAQSFLFRWLAPMAAMLDEWEAVGSGRHRLLDARIAPPVALPWLAGFLGLALDACWPEAVQRRMILEAAALFRTRGTLASLRRMVEILSDAEVVVIEQFRLRGGGVVGNPDSVASQAVLGGGYRVGGMIGERDQTLIEGAAEVDFDDFAHRFTVIVVAALSEAQLSCMRRLIEQHKPAHTDFTLCTANGGLRAGVGAHVGLSSVIGKSGKFETALVGDAVLGAGFVLGRPALDPETTA